MIKCPSCGTMNEPGSSFCFQCGSDIRDVGRSDVAPTASQIPPPPGFPPSSQPQGFPSASQPPGFPPPTQFGSPQGYDPNRQWTPDYMTPPEEPKRRRWLWITLGLILGCILLCVVGSILISTSDTVADLATSISEFSTEEADSN